MLAINVSDSIIIEDSHTRFLRSFGYAERTIASKLALTQKVVALIAMCRESHAASRYLPVLFVVLETKRVALRFEATGGR